MAAASKSCRVSSFRPLLGSHVVSIVIETLGGGFDNRPSWKPLEAAVARTSLRAILHAHVPRARVHGRAGVCPAPRAGHAPAHGASRCCATDDGGR
eukprot:6504798-Prymnesium_polylepis.1